MRTFSNSEKNNITRWNNQKNFFETYYIKWNDIEQQQAGWIRYTIYHSDKFSSEAAVWIVFIDKKSPENNIAIKQTYPLTEVAASADKFFLQIAESGITQQRAWGKLQQAGASIAWNVYPEKGAIMINHLPALLYRTPMPTTKFLAPLCWYRLSGEVQLNGKIIPIHNAQAHEGHFWGTKQVTSWTWGNCSAFKEDPDFYFEGVTAQMHLLKKPMPRMTCLFFHWQNQLYACNGLLSSLTNVSQHNLREWHFKANCKNLTFVGRMSSKPEDMILYQFQDPDGQYRYSHNNFMADLEIDIYPNRGRQQNKKIATLTALGTAAFEVAQPERDPSVLWQVGF